MDSYVVEGKNISFEYRDSLEGIQNVNFVLQPGEVILVTGNSGSGKSTFLKCLNGLIPRVVEGKLEGKILLNHQNTKDMSMAEISRHISSVFQNPRSQFFTTNTTSELVFSMENYGLDKAVMEERIQKVSALLQIQYLLNRDIFQLSGGERQMVAIASAMMMGQQIILLDEPSANLDYHNTYVFRGLVEKLKQEGYTVLIADHRFYYLSRLINRVFLFDDGKMQIFDSEQAFKESSYDTRSFDLFAMNIPFQTACEKKEKVLSLVDISYKDILQDITLDFFTNEVSAIIGTNGVGKTTLARILCKSISCTHGKIIGEIPFYIMQDADYQLFGTSVQAELEIADHKIKQKDIQDVMDYFQLTKYADTHPFSLSGGEKQRISIARALLKDAPIILLDEATSSVDPENEAEILAAIDALCKGKTVISIAHRISTVENVDHILVIDDGSLQEEGKHEELIQNGGIYASFIKSRKDAKGWRIEN